MSTAPAYQLNERPEQGKSTCGSLSRRSRILLICVAVSIYLIYCVSVSLNRAPWYDEGFLVNPAYAWITTGYPGVSILDDTGTYIPTKHSQSMRGIREHMYLEMPLHVVALGAWLKIFGFGVVSSRLFTVFCGVALLLIWYSAVRRLTEDATVAAIAVALLATDYGFVIRATEARMDMLSAAFGFGGLAVYLYMRTRSFPWAVFLSHLCVSASAFTHPNGGIVAWGGLIFLTLFYDRRSIRFRHVLIALLPYLIGAAGWGLYIAQDFDSFKAQFSVNLTHGGRLQTFTAPFWAIRREIELRFLGTIGGVGGESRLLMAKLLIVFVYWAGLAGVLATKSLRQQKGYRALLALTGIYFVLLAFSDGRKAQTYIVHFIPLYTALAAGFMVWLWRNHQRAVRVLIVVVFAALSAVHAAGVAYQVHLDGYHKTYLPAIAFLKQNVRAQELIIGPGVLGLGLAYPPNLIDDFRLGKISGKAPEWIVINDWYREWFLGLKASEPETYKFVLDRLKNDYHPVYDHAFTIYRKNGLSLGSS
jgi:4-amino-4-deoxy-L-arabinose transferase-like glycosyltransferase